MGSNPIRDLERKKDSAADALSIRERKKHLSFILFIIDKLEIGRKKFMVIQF